MSSSFAPILVGVTSPVSEIPYESICWRGINVGGLAVER